MKPKELLTRISIMQLLPSVRNSSADPIRFAVRIDDESDWRLACVWNAFGPHKVTIDVIEEPFDSPIAIMKFLADGWAAGPDELLPPYREMVAK